MSSMAKLKIAGAWLGSLEVQLENWTVPMLREEVARRSNILPQSIKMICGGKVLKDGDGTENLSQLGVKNNSKVLVTRVSSVEESKELISEEERLRKELLVEEERNQRLARIKAAVSAMSKRHAGGVLPIEDFDIELEDQDGQKLHFSENDRQAIMMALMLHANGKRLIKKQMYKDALEVLEMGEEAFSLCNPMVIELVDNVPILQIDMVWCYFMLQDIASLSVAGKHLEKSREGLERSHGKDSSRFRLLQAGHSSELALYLRLELLEGVVAYHSGQFDKAKKFFTSAQVKFNQLQVPDDLLSIVMSMGFGEQDAKRALRMSNLDVQSAVDFLVDQKEKRALKREDDIRRRAEIMEQKKYGVTPLKKAVDLQRLKELVSMGFERELAAEALRRNENDTQKALDDLTNRETNIAIQNHVHSMKRKKPKKVDNNMVEQLVSMGFERSRVVEAVQTHGSLDQSMQHLIQQPAQPTPDPTGHANNNESEAPNNAVLEGSNQDILTTDDDVGGPSTSEAEPRDVEMEDEIADELAQGNPLSDYDIELTKEGEAISEYLALLDSAGSSENASTSH